MASQRFARLRARVIELARLADNDRAGADEENGFYVGAFWHLIVAQIAARIGHP